MKFVVTTTCDCDVCDFSPERPPAPGLGRGVIGVDSPGFFLYSDTAPYMEVKTVNVSSPMIRQKARKLSRKGWFQIHSSLHIEHVDVTQATCTDMYLTPLASETESRKTQKAASRKLDVSMISGPKDDLRHTGHIGCDGAVFGDVSFIGENYSKLPMKISSE